MILLLNRSFYPDIEGTGQNLTQLASNLAKAFPITALCGRSYSVPDRTGTELFEGIRILRVGHTRFPKNSTVGRLVNWLSFGFMAFIAALRQRPRILFVQTDPPFLGIMALLLRRFYRCAMVLNCRDLYPDVALELGVIRPGWVSRLFERLNVRAFRESVVTVALGHDMAQRIIAKGIPRERVIVIPNAVDASSLVPVDKNQSKLAREYKLDGRFTVMYSGNMGLTQDFDTFIDAISGMPIDPARWMLLMAGSGAARKRVEERIRQRRLNNTLWLPSQPQEALGGLLGCASLHVIPMKKGMAGCVVPGKVYSIMAAGRPFLAICDHECDMAKLALEGCGLWAPAGDVEAVKERLQWAIEHPQDLERMGRKGRQVAVERFDAPIVMARWKALFEDLYSK